MVCMLQEGEHFLGMFNQESAAARACDVAALKLHGSSATTNFPARYCCAVKVMPSDLTAGLAVGARFVALYYAQQDILVKVATWE